MERTLFISSTYVKQFTQIQGNVADDKVNLSIELAQQKYILPVLGKTLYDYLVTSISQNGGLGGLPVQYVELVDYITPTLTEWSLYEATLIMAFQFQNKGIGRHQDAYLNQTPLDELKYLRSELRNNAEWYQERLKKYLEYNKAKFPEYSVESFDLNPSTQTGRPFSGIVFDRKRKNRLINTYTEEHGFGDFGNTGYCSPTAPVSTAGTSGSTGTSGSAGTSGTEGTSGSNGTSGTEGTSGTSGTEGTSGSSGDILSGTEGTSGLGIEEI